MLSRNFSDYMFLFFSNCYHCCYQGTSPITCFKFILTFIIVLKKINSLVYYCIEKDQLEINEMLCLLQNKC